MNVWIQAARPKTLFVSMAPVIVAISLALGKGIAFPILPAIICMVFALLAQIISNFVNDYADFVKGCDDSDRIGPRRMLASGLISKKEMIVAILICSVVLGMLGLSLVYWGGAILVPIGIAIFIGAYSYSAGPFPLSHHGLGDVAVVLFYGFVPVVFTYYVLCTCISVDVCLCGIAMGLVADELLIVNNYRDYEQDKKHNKKTTVVLFGKKFMHIVFLLNPIIAIGLGFFFIKNLCLWSLLGFCFIAVSFVLWRELKKTESAALNKLLAKASALSILYALLILASSTI